MKKKILFIFMLCVFAVSTMALAADQGYEFFLNYEGDVVAGVEKNAIVTLTGTEATPYTNVRVESVHMSGPAKATIYAYDANGNKFDLTETGEWGPTSGFAVGGTFTNETPITAIYPEAGTYVSRLSLIDLSNNNQVITSKEFTVTVKAAATEQEPIVPETNTTVTSENNMIESIPEAGISWWVYLLVIGAVIVAAWEIIQFIRNNKD